MIKKILEKSKKIENLLEINYGASGRGLHEKVTSVESKLDSSDVKKIRWIATIRNKSVHEDGFEVEDIDAFINASNQIISNLSKLPRQSIHSRFTLSNNKNFSKNKYSAEPNNHKDYSNINTYNESTHTSSEYYNKALFWKHLYNWKYLIWPLLLGAMAAVDYSTTGQIKKSFSFLLLIVILTQTSKFKVGFFRKIYMFVASTITIFLSYVLIILLMGIFLNKPNSALIEKILEKNNNLPKMINEEIEQIKVTSDNKNIIYNHLRFVNYTKNEILEEYQNDSSKVTSELFRLENETSCPDKNVQKILSKGIYINIIYYDKSNIEIGRILIDSDSCRKYNKSRQL